VSVLAVVGDREIFVYSYEISEGHGELGSKQLDQGPFICKTDGLWSSPVTCAAVFTSIKASNSELGTE
jgi:hypothetical protein